MRLIVAALFLFVFFVPSDVAAQRGSCSGHRIHWLGGAPQIGFDRGRAPQDHTDPWDFEPAVVSMNRDLWDALVYDAYDHPTPNRSSQGGMSSLPLEERRTLVMTGDQVISLNICIQSADESQTGRRLDTYHDPAWWHQELFRITGVFTVPTVRVDACASEPQIGWVHIREARAGELSNNALAGAASWRYIDPHGVRSEWAKSEIVWHPEYVLQASNARIERTLAHELGHVVGFWHTPPGSGFVMEDGYRSRRSDIESELGSWAYLLGPNVQYPGFVRGTDVPALPLVGVVLLAFLLMWRRG